MGTETTPNSAQKLTESVEIDVDETVAAAATSNFNDTPGISVNVSSDSRKENRVPRQDQEKLAQKMERSNDVERQVSIIRSFDFISYTATKIFRNIGNG